jgi:5,10-methylenetetrahydromethanopterin reductase
MSDAEYWRHGGTPTPATNVAAYARRFEDLGWDGLMVGQDIGVGPDSYLFLAYAAAATSRLKVGTGVSIPVRHAMDVANTIITLWALTGRRSYVSFGRGDGGFAQIGRPPMKVGEFTDYMTQVDRYLRHLDVDLDGFASNLSAIFGHDSSLDLDKPPVDISATGPRMIDYAARTADGVSFAVGANVSRLRECVELAGQAHDSTSRTPGSLALSAYVPIAVHGVEGVDRDTAREIVRGVVLRHSRFSAFEGKLLGNVAATDQQAILRSFEVTRDYGRRMPKKPDFAAGSGLPDDYVDRFAVVGDPRECADRLSEIAGLGINRLVLLTRVPTTDPDEDNATRVGRYVLPLVK